MAFSLSFTTRSKGVPGYCIQSADFAHVCHLQAVLRRWQRGSHGHRGVSAQHNIKRQQGSRTKSLLSYCAFNGLFLSDLNFIAESLLERAEQWNSWAPDPSKILCKFLSVIPPPERLITTIKYPKSNSSSIERKCLRTPGMIVILPLACEHMEISNESPYLHM